MLKLGPEERKRGEYCLHLGDGICPRVYALLENGYVMEVLERADRTEPGLLRTMEVVLEAHVWSDVWDRPPGSVPNWLDHLRKRIDCPEPPAHGPIGRTHGDSTVSNAMRRGDGTLVIIDPLPPKPHVANCREADMGRILQSAMGWEVLMYGEEPVEWMAPYFWFDDQLRRAALWWCGATARRIMVNEQREAVLAWCTEIAERCFDEYRV